MTVEAVPGSRELGAFKAHLPVWIALSIAAGLVAGSFLPGAFTWLRALEVGSVNLGIAALV